MNYCGKIIPKFVSRYQCVVYLVVFILFACANIAAAQHVQDGKKTVPPVKDSVNKDTVTLAPGSVKKDTVAVADTSKIKHLEDSLGIRISRDALPAAVKADATDSAVLDMKSNLFYLYGKAQVNYQDLQLNAGKITFVQSENRISAEPAYDTLGGQLERPSFIQGKEKFTYDSMQYNFKSKRAIVLNVRSQYGEGYMFSSQVKRNPDQSIYGFRSVYTTCALDTPHFGIVAKKIRVIPGRLIATGPANIVIEGVPTPLFLPFGLFPISEKQRSGFVIPTYTLDVNKGLGLTNGGYYFYLNDHVDLLTQANIYTKGSYAVSGVSTYSNIYKYSGGVSFSYSSYKTGENYEPGAITSKDFILNWRHQTDGKAKPGESLNASVNAGTSTYYSINSYDPNQILQNQLSSNVSYSKNWIGTPFSLTISALHNQNTRSRLVNVTLPSINFHVNQLNPFQNKRSIGTHWYDKITTSYSVDAMNTTSFYDSAFSFKTLDASKFRSGIHHNIPVNASYTVLRYINMSFNVNYNEYWLTERIYQNYNLADKKIDSNDMHGFYTARDFSTSLNFSSRIYGMKLFKSGKLRGIRHVITPTVGMSYHPDFGAAPYNYYYRSRVDSFNYAYLSPFQTSVIGAPTNGKSGSVNFGLNNNLQIKVRSSKDTTTGYKNITLIDGFGFTSAYNLAADSFQWSPIGVHFSTNVLDKINISSSASYDPYRLNYDGTRSRQTLWDAGKGIARFTSAQLSLGSNFHSKPVNGKTDATNSEEYARLMRNNGYNDYIDLNIPWSVNLSYSLQANKNFSYYSHSDTLVLTHNLMIQGEFTLTERWKVSVSSGYNFNYRQLQLTSIDIYRDLHCWQMHFQTIPFGPRKSYNFTLNVKAAILQDLKLIRRRDYRDITQ